jgi:hypothetical protein
MFMAPIDTRSSYVTIPANQPGQRPQSRTGKTRTNAATKRRIAPTADDQPITPELANSNKIVMSNERLLICMIVPVWLLLMVLAGAALIFGNPSRWAIALMLSGVAAPPGALVGIIVRHYFKLKR